MEFIRENTYTPTPRVEIVTKISKFPNYEITTINGQLFIVGYGSDAQAKYDYVIKKNNMILFELLALYKNLDAKSHAFQDKIDQEITKKDKYNIIRFCRKNGLPFWNNKRTNNAFENENDTQLNGLINTTFLRGITPFADENEQGQFYNICPLASFIVGLNHLYFDFLAVATVRGWRDDINVINFIDDKAKEYMENVSERYAQNKELLLFCNNLKPFVTYFDNTNFKLCMNCENIMHLASYHLCLLMSAPTISNGYIKQCPYCTNYFITNNSRQKFCNNPCTRQAYYQHIKYKPNAQN